MIHVLIFSICTIYFPFIIILFCSQKAMDLKKERKKTDALLSEMLPGHIVSMLKLGQEPRPKLYE